MFMLDRFLEKSTYTGIVQLLMSFGLFGWGEGEWNTLVAAIVGVVGLMAMLMKEKSVE